MKTLDKVTLEDAIKIISADLIGDWEFTVFSHSSQLRNRHSDYRFVFNKDEILCGYIQEEGEASYMQYLRAWKLGYYVPEMSEFLDNELKIKELEGKLEIYKIFSPISAGAKTNAYITEQKLKELKQL